MDLYFYTYSGISLSIAQELSKHFNLKPKSIITHKRSYFFWLFLSFFPNLPVKITYEEPKSSYGILIFPKWTFNCPPVTAFLKKVKFEKLLLIITFGGWREKPYGEHYKELALEKSKCVEVIFIKRSNWLNNRVEELGVLIEKSLTFFKEFQN